MFEAVELNQSLSKAEFKAEEPTIRAALLDLQRKLKKHNVATLIIVAGVEGAGKGDVVNRLNKWFDSRGVETHAFWDMTDEERERPNEWKFWRHLPSRGSLAIMFGGWYWDPLYSRMRGEIDDAELDEVARRINELEHMLQTDEMLIIKLWFHLSKNTHKKRMKKRSELQSQIHALNKEQNSGQYYKEFLEAAERTIRLTDTGECPWQLIEADDKWFRDMSVARVLQSDLGRRLSDQRVSTRRAVIHEPVIPVDDNPVTILDKIDLSTHLSAEDYKDNLYYYQTRLRELSWNAYDAHSSTVIVFEGWDAAGKGGAIRRLTSAIDARLYRVISIAAPSDEELAHHYLWRFWRQVPRSGYIRIYDRSWYGRVLVERVEGLAKPDEWMRSYQEINDFEEQLSDHGMVLIKFWLHIDRDEQLKRFHEREVTDWKKHKISDEDWRNREKWNDYKTAVNTMVAHTSTGKNPWTLIPANDKYHARIEILKTVCENLERVLKR